MCTAAKARAANACRMTTCSRPHRLAEPPLASDQYAPAMPGSPPDLVKMGKLGPDARGAHLAHPKSSKDGLALGGVMLLSWGAPLSEGKWKISDYCRKPLRGQPTEANMVVPARRGAVWVQRGLSGLSISPLRMVSWECGVRVTRDQAQKGGRYV